MGISILGWLVLGTLLIGWHKARGTLWPLAPGEWLTLAAGITVVSLVTAVAICESFFPYPPWVPNLDFNSPAYQQFLQQLQAMGRWRTLLIVLAFICSATGYGVAAFATRQRKDWSLLMGMGAAMFSLFGGQVLWDTFYNGFPIQPFLYIAGGVALLAVVPLVTAILVDRSRRVPRHWLHWSGAVITITAMWVFGGTMIIIFYSNS